MVDAEVGHSAQQFRSLVSAASPSVHLTLHREHVQHCNTIDVDLNATLSTVTLEQCYCNDIIVLNNYKLASHSKSRQRPNSIASNIRYS